VLPPDMISFAKPDDDDVLRACVEAVRRVTAGEHNPRQAHERVRGFYGWEQVAVRTEQVYENVIVTPPKDFWTRLQR
jgi:phosphatidylinositol glycan class A protein